MLSQAFVAFVIEFDNEFEQRVPHRTTEDKTGSHVRGGPWLGSMAMWVKFLRFVPVIGGITIREFAVRSKLGRRELRPWLRRLSRWGYLLIERTSEAKGDWLCT